jgi:hypothetical protein
MAGAGFTRSDRKTPNGLALAVVLAALAGGAHAQVQVQSLAAPDLFSIGAEKSDLPAGLWKGSSASLARLVLPQIAASRTLTPAAATLARRLLSAPTTAPDGAGDDAELAGFRAQALLSLGALDVVGVILDRTTDLPQKPAFSEAAAQAALIRGQDDKACAIGDGLGVGKGLGFWIRLRAYCQARAGQSAPAQLTFELANSQDPRPEYERLMTALLAGQDAGAPALDDALDYAISRKVSAGWAQGLADAAPAPAVALAGDAGSPLATRLAAAARAERLGVSVPQAYAAIQPPPADLAAADQPGPAGEAALVALASATSDLALKESAVMALLKRAHDGPEFQALARLCQPYIAQLLAAGAVLRQPALIALAAAAAGDGADASAALLQLNAKDAAHPLPLDLALLEALVAAASGQGQEAAVQALDAQVGASDAAGKGRAAAGMALLGALGAPVGPQALLDVSAADLGPQSAPPARLQAMELAASQGRMGDVALYVLQSSMEAGPAGPAPGERASLVRALWAAGLKADAQSMAIEGLVALQARP